MLAATMRFGVGFFVSAFLLSVGCAGGGNGEETFVVRLSSDEPCYGIEIDVDQSGLSTPDRGTTASCAASAALLAEGCDFETKITSNEYQISARGCFADDDTALFSCTVPGALADRFRNDLEIRCGCGCADDCPSQVETLVCDANGASCQAAPFVAAPVAQPAPAQTTTVQRGAVQSTTSTSSTTPCGTCCDAGVEPGIAMDSDELVRELSFTIRLDAGECQDFDCEPLDDFDGPQSFVDSGNGQVRVCLSSDDGVSGAVDLLDCEAFTGGDDLFTISGVQALGARLEPLSPPPLIVNDPND